jgi:hypothetical protein
LHAHQKFFIFGKKGIAEKMTCATPAEIATFLGLSGTGDDNMVYDFESHSICRLGRAFFYNGRKLLAYSEEAGCFVGNDVAMCLALVAKMSIDENSLTINISVRSAVDGTVSVDVIKLSPRRAANDDLCKEIDSYLSNPHADPEVVAEAKRLRKIVKKINLAKKKI